ncbi:hypothetical protein UCD39_14305 [Nitrospirillum sp. BR 11752]|uniref:hypothetical protein n=1 Tax=Nitrospirillum sp. BR 11752 TaxID=3104293 RepID=UPI002EC62247|nr:hypothetical protein [Nitrospirillum sp. BR 11752]
MTTQATLTVPSAYPVYKFVAPSINNSQERVYFSLNLNDPVASSGFVFAGIAFLAFPSPDENLVPVYQFTIPSPSDQNPLRFYYSPNSSPSAGWVLSTTANNKSGIAFYTPASTVQGTVPVYNFHYVFGALSLWNNRYQLSPNAAEPWTASNPAIGFYALPL